MIYFISDTHFWHKNILQYEDRPFIDLSDMTDKLIANWNSIVDQNDTVIHLGDFIMGNKEMAKNILSQLNGYKILVKGNHDCHSNQWFLDAGFDEVGRRYIINYDSKVILCTHNPSNIPMELIGKYDLHFYGHVHGKGNVPGVYPTYARNGACLCVERHNYKPIDLDTIIARCGASDCLFSESSRML